MQPEEMIDRLRAALAGAQLGTWTWDLTTRRIDWDASLEALFGLAPGTFPGTPEAYLAMVHPDDRDQVNEAVDAAIARRAAYIVEHRTVWPDGSVHWVHCRGGVIVDDDGRPTGTAGCVGDVTARRAIDQDRERQTEEARDEATQEREQREWSEALLAVNEALLNARSRRDVMRNVTRTSVPALGDWCAMFVLGPTAADPPDIEIVHLDPLVTEMARRLRRDVPHVPDARYGVASVIRSRRTQFFEHVDDDLLRTQVPDDAWPFMHSLGISSSITVPIVKQSHVYGALQFLLCDPTRTYHARDVEYAEAVAFRVASALDNLRLVEQQRHIANTLQASLLPERLPTMPGFEVGVRYWAVGEATVVGGDFYDLFELDDDTFAIVIGDVCGTGPSAAALTGLARHTIRAAARHGDSASEVLHHLNHAVGDVVADSFCTALYGTVRLGPEPTVRFASAGHPLPIVVRPEGGSRSLGRPGTLLGVFPTIDVHEVEVAMGSGDVLVLYTDGCTDHLPPGSLTTADFEQIVAAAAEGATNAEGIASAIGRALADLVPIASRDDDIALLVLRRA